MAASKRFSNSIFVLLTVVSSVIFNLTEAKTPNTPDYYNDDDIRWDNGDRTITYNDDAFEVTAQIMREEEKYEAGLIEEERRDNASKNDQSNVKKMVRQKSTLLTGTLQRTIQRKTGLAFDICYFHVDILRSICVEGMQRFEATTDPTFPVYYDHLDALLDEYDYGCEPMTTPKHKKPRNAVYCPFKLKYSEDVDRPGYVKLSYVPGFYITQSRFRPDILYLFKQKKDNFRRPNNANMLEPFAEMSGIDLERGSRFSDLPRAFMQWN